ncbi:MAG: ATP-binding protein, partial [Pseudomonadales bacterium]
QLRFAGPPRTMYRFSYVDVLEGRVPADALRDKIVYVGATATGLGDDVPTPFGAMPGVELHANAFHALRSNGFINTLSPHNTAILHGLLALVTCLALSRMAPRAFLLGTLFVLLAFAAAVTALFFLALQWFRPTPFFAALIVFYPLWSWRRIEIAMGFLRRELAELQGVPAERAPRVEQMREQLESLVDLGVLQQARIEPVAAVTYDERWPQYKSNAALLSSVFILEEKCYRVELAATPNSTKGRQLPLATLACLMDELPAQEKPSDDSYELVERTIAEIYAARKVVERTRERMNESMARLQDVVVVSDIAGRIIFINDRGAVYFEPNLGGQSIFTLQRFLGQPVWQATLRLLMVDGEQVYREVETGNGKLLLCQATRLVETDAFRDTLLFVFTDVTELRALEQGKNEALAFLSHDMRSPLVSQLALIENFRIEETSAVGRERELLDKLVYFAERSLKYSEDFLQLARAENIDQDSFQLVDLHGVVDAALAEVAGLALQQGVRLEIVRTVDDCWMLGDAQLLERAVSNLLSNAIQHSAQGESVMVTLGNEERLSVCVADNGSGIDAEALPHLFKPYFRARRAAQRSSAGVPGAQIPADNDASQESERILSRNYGLGLSFVHSVVERHGGQIDVQSVLGAGTRITLYLPATELD